MYCNFSCDLSLFLFILFLLLPSQFSKISIFLFNCTEFSHSGLDFLIEMNTFYSVRCRVLSHDSFMSEPFLNLLHSMMIQIQCNETDEQKQFRCSHFSWSLMGFLARICVGLVWGCIHWRGEQSSIEKRIMQWHPSVYCVHAAGMARRKLPLFEVDFSALYHHRMICMYEFCVGGFFPFSSQILNHIRFAFAQTAIG